MGSDMKMLDFSSIRAAGGCAAQDTHRSTTPDTHRDTTSDTHRDTASVMGIRPEIRITRTPRAQVRTLLALALTLEL